jgi:hypothetical protein
MYSNFLPHDFGDKRERVREIENKNGKRERDSER